MPSVRIESVRNLAANWARRRQGQDAHSITLKRRRIYILPTRNGLIFAAVVFAMLLASLQYAASLGFAMTFLLAGLGLVAMHYCHNNLLAITVHFAGADPVFAGDEIRFRLALENRASQPRFDLVAECGDARTSPIDLAPETQATVHLHRPSKARGYVRLDRFSIATRHPANLFRAWTWVHMDARALVYPAPAGRDRPMPGGIDSGGARIDRSGADDDFAGLREATPGDPPKRLAWKAFARSDQLLAKEFAGGSEAPRVFDFNALTGMDAEARLAQLCRWCLDAAGSGLSFGLVLPDSRIAVGSGDRHLHQCLQALALFESQP